MLSFLFSCKSAHAFIHVQYSDIMRFRVRNNRHHKVSLSVPLFKSRKTVSIFLRIKVGGHFVMSIVKCHESHYVGVLDNPPCIVCHEVSNSPKYLVVFFYFKFFF